MIVVRRLYGEWHVVHEIFLLAFLAFLLSSSSFLLYAPRFTAFSHATPAPEEPLRHRRASTRAPSMRRREGVRLIQRRCSTARRDSHVAVTEYTPKIIPFIHRGSEARTAAHGVAATNVHVATNVAVPRAVCVFFFFFSLPFAAFFQLPLRPVFTPGEGAKRQPRVTDMMRRQLRSMMSRYGAPSL